jgi:hypothetical protein
MKRWQKILASVSTVMILLVALVWKQWGNVETIVNFKDISHERGYACIAQPDIPIRKMFFSGLNLKIKYKLQSGDSEDNLSRSTVQLFEDGRALGPSHSQHDDIRNIGRGKFSHWGGTLYFSASDNSDPQTSGKIYTAKARLTMKGGCKKTLNVLLALAIAGLMGSLPGSFFASRRASNVPVRLAISLRLGIFLMLLMVCSAWIKATKEIIPIGFGSLEQKMKYYGLHKNEYDMLFIGDSRTYCGIHPHKIDPLLGTHSYNLSSMAHWFPTQYPQFEDLSKMIPPGTTVVYSIGHQNFDDCVLGEKELWAANSPYDIGWKNFFLYWFIGFPVESEIQNVWVYSGIHLATETLRAKGNSIKSGLLNFFLRPNKPDVANQPSSVPGKEAIYQAEGAEGTAEELLKRFGRDAGNRFVEAVYDAGKLNSIVLSRKEGGYCRIELDQEYFRNKQRAMAPTPLKMDGSSPHAFKPDPRYWALFLRILDTFKAYHIRLIVNEMEEAPFTYSSNKILYECRRFMREAVEPQVRLRGFQYVRANMDLLSDDDYFDYNHLNSKGIGKYSHLLSEQLQPLLRNKGR